MAAAEEATAARACQLRTSVSPEVKGGLNQLAAALETLGDVGADHLLLLEGDAGRLGQGFGGAQVLGGLAIFEVEGDLGDDVEEEVGGIVEAGRLGSRHLGSSTEVGKPGRQGIDVNLEPIGGRLRGGAGIDDEPVDGRTKVGKGQVGLDLGRLQVGGSNLVGTEQEGIDQVMF